MKKGKQRPPGSAKRTQGSKKGAPQDSSKDDRYRWRAPDATAACWGLRVNSLATDQVRLKEVIQRFPFSKDSRFGEYCEALENFIPTREKYDEVAHEHIEATHEAISKHKLSDIDDADAKRLRVYEKLLDSADRLLTLGCPRPGMLTEPINYYEWLALLQQIQEQLGEDMTRRKKRRLRAKRVPPFGPFLFFVPSSVVDELCANLRIIIESHDFSRARNFRLLERLVNDRGGEGVKCTRDQRNNLGELLKKKAKETGNMAYRETARALRYKRDRARLDIPPDRIEIR